MANMKRLEFDVLSINKDLSFETGTVIDNKYLGIMICHSGKVTQLNRDEMLELASFILEVLVERKG